MSSVTGLGTYARYTSLVRTLSQGQARVDDLSTQLTTGKKSLDLAAYGPDTQKLLDLRAEMAKRDSYVQNIDTASPRVAATDTVMTTLEKMATDWQSSNLMPFEPGPVSVTTPSNVDPAAMKVTVNQDKSTFVQDAKFTVTAVPSQSGVNGSFDVTVTDGLGGRSTRSINLKTVPPDDGTGYNFRIGGGSGGGAVLNLSFDNLKAASSSSFNVSWPQADQLKDRIDGAMRDIQESLNQRFGDRYLFSGSRYATEPVSDLSAQRQTTKITLNGAMVNTDDYFEVTIDGKPFSYQVQPNDPKTVTFVAQSLNSAIQSADPKLSLVASASNGIITLTGNDVTDQFDISARVMNASNVDNSVTTPTTLQSATPAAPAGTGLTQVDRFTLTGKNVDIGDTFSFTVGVGNADDPYNQQYYNQHPNEPKDLPPYQAYTVSYTVTAQDYKNGVVDVAHVADQLRQQYANIKPAPPFTMDAPGSGQSITLTGTQTADPNHPSITSQFTTTTSVVNGNIGNTITVNNMPTDSESVIDQPQAEPPNLAYYDTDFLTKKQDPKAWDKTAVTIDDGLSLSYGVTSNDPAFQTLIKAFRMARLAAANPGSYDNYVNQSRTLMAQANDQLRSVHAKVSSDASTLDQQKTAHNDAIATLTNRIAGIEGIDETEVATRLKASMNALEAAYTVAGQTQKLSLLNYLA